MTFSMNEIEAMGKRAARGAGLDWGIAEEAGKAARWLSARGLPGARLLADALALADGKPHAALAPVSTDGVWRAPSGALCPLAAGAALSDLGDRLVEGHEIALGQTAFPLLLVPYAAMVARAGGVGVALSWPGAELTVGPDGSLTAKGAAAALATAEAESVRCRKAAAPVPASAPAAESVDTETWGRLDAFAQRTYAPATEASRVLGAGAGLSDND